ncbi:neuropilin and tolloid-like protein 1 [Elysia marginata]|uniref:Neuropilin and tolloid-like protein 1 n=1 Tax=Elysia marginata TaxID=1093978 RepID=A0AAV4H9W9_9GAST|nr:neuropilin and tolloid-like protein 1 [Elysia marginata]
MGRARVTAGRLLLRQPGGNIRFEKCYMFIKAPANRRLILKFHEFNVPAPYGCDKDNLQLFDDVAFQRPLTERLCNTGKLPNRAYVTSAEDAAVRLTKERYLEDQAEIVFTAFHYAPCIGNEFECKNGHCIDGDLYCNGSDNCGDESDYCFLRPGTMIGIIIAVVIVIVIVAIVVGLLLYNRQRKIRREREKQILSDLALEVSHTNKSYLGDWDHSGARTLSDLSSIESRSSAGGANHHNHHHHHSHLHHSNSQTQLHKVHLDNGEHHHHHNLLGKRDDQLRHGAGAAGEKAGIEGRGHPYDAEMASKVTYIVQGDTGSSPTSRISTIDRDRSHGVDPYHSPKSPVRRSKSLNSRTPFYFEKDDYYSDGSSTWHAVDDSGLDSKTHHGGKKHQRRSTKKPVSRSGSSALYANGHVKRRKDKPKAKSKKGKKLKKKSSFGEEDRSDDGYESPPIDYNDFAPMGAGTMDRRAGTNGNSVPLHVSTSYHPSSPTIYLTPPGEAATAFPHMPQKAANTDNMSPSTTVTRNGKILVSNVVPIGPPLGLKPDDPDILYAKPQKKRASDNSASVTGGDTVVIETSPSEATGLAARRDSSPLLLHSVQPRQTVQQSQNRVDTPGPRGHTQTGDNEHYVNARHARESGDENFANTTAENTVIATSPLDNSKILELNRGSPTRRSALQARHPDGSPFLLHTADSKQVQKQLKEHPEDGADVLDHVISFRCYDSPVPREEMQLFQSGTNRRSGRSRKSGRSRASMKS